MNSSTAADSDQSVLDQTATQLDEEATQTGLSEAQYKRKMQRRKEVQDAAIGEPQRRKRADHRQYWQR